MAANRVKAAAGRVGLRVGGVGVDEPRVAVRRPGPLSRAKFAELLGTEEPNSHNPAKVSFRLGGCWSEFANAIRRGVGEAAPGVYLAFGISGYSVSSSDRYNSPEYVSRVLATVPLPTRALKYAGAEFSLDVENRERVPRGVRLSDLADHGADPALRRLFNEHTVLFDVQPGSRLAFSGVTLKAADSRAPHCSVAAGAHRSALTPLDLEEHPPEEVFTATGAHRDESGFVLPTGIAEPRVFRVSYECNVVEEREAWLPLRRALDSLQARCARIVAVADTAAWTSADLVDGGAPVRESTLSIVGENSTVTKALERMLYEALGDGVLMVNSIAPPDKNCVVITMRAAPDVDLKEAFKGAAAEFAAACRSISATVDKWLGDASAYL